MEPECNITCGMIVIFDLKSSSPRVEMSMPSISMNPPADSMILNNARVSDDLPAPVRPTIPTCIAHLYITGKKERNKLAFIIQRGQIKQQ